MIPTVSLNQIAGTLTTTQSTSLEASILSSSKGNGAQTSSSDIISLQSDSTLSVTYSSTMQMSDSNTARYGMLQNLVANLLKEQGIDTKIATGDSTIDIAAITPAAAQQLISDDGYFGVKQTSDRIFQFATGVAGGDPSRIAAIKEGIDKGFAEAKKALGDWLPDISSKTYDAVMKKLDEWVAGSTASA